MDENIIDDAVRNVLDTAKGWLGWDRRPVAFDGNAWTPHKSLRRITGGELLQVVLTATAGNRDGGDPEADWVDFDGYEQRSTVLPLELARPRITEPPALPFLALLEARAG